MTTTKSLLIHAFLIIIYATIMWFLYGPVSSVGAAWGGALSTISLLGLSEFLGGLVPKKGIALVFVGSVLRYGILIMVFALSWFTDLKIPLSLIGGLFLWVPSSILIYWLSGKRRESAF